MNGNMEPVCDNCGREVGGYRLSLLNNSGVVANFCCWGCHGQWTDSRGENDD